MAAPAPLVVGIDQGTSGTTCVAVSLDGSVRARTHVDVAVRHPRSGWVEQDAAALWDATCAAMRALMHDLEAAPVALGITNQRETLVVFDRRTLEPVAPAIVWQDRRGAAICDEHRARGEEAALHRRSGLLLDPYFTATKLEWLLRAQPELRERAARGELCAGTVDTWLIARMTHGTVFVSDASNASRTLLYDLREGDISDELCAMFGVPRALLPDVVVSAGTIATTDADAFVGLELPICGVAGDQQAALFGQGCVRRGMSKNTYGTGAFLLTNTGTQIADADALLASVAWRTQAGDTFALEGSIFTTGAALRWLRDGLRLIDDVADAGPLMESVADSAGCVFVPALTGLGAPWWDPDARGAFLNLHAGVTRAHLVRAVVEAVAHRTRDVVEAMQRSAAVHIPELRVDGGASVMDALCQYQADILGIPVTRAATAEATAAGAALLAAVGAELLPDVGAAAATWRPGARFEPGPGRARADENYAAWLRALDRVRTGGRPRG